MAKKSGATKQELQFAELLRLGGKKIPAGLAGKAAAATKTLRQKQLNAVTEMRRRATKLQGEVTGASPVADKKALDEILSQHKKMASKKLAFPRPPGGIIGIWPGSYGGTVVPPFDFADTIPTVLAGATPTLSVSANVNGQISASAATVQSGFNGGSEYARVGIFFHPTALGILTISSSPTYSFQWATNSLGSSYVDSEGSVGLDIYGMNEFGEILSSNGGNYTSWQELTTGQVNLDFGFDITGSMSVSLEVNPGQVYLCFVEVDAHVAGDGWMGIPNNQSLATASVSATVPSISYEFRPLLLNHP